MKTAPESTADRPPTTMMQQELVTFSHLTSDQRTRVQDLIALYGRGGPITQEEFEEMQILRLQAIHHLI
ncbi:hypothetical protein KJ652_00625 [Patescibacteria group bacterium]|nr:hypothetical protein [Patescibacteria group bacterium]MBU1123076.1 hypothetical protein [Patescibacteria group bacterium]